MTECLRGCNISDVACDPFTKDRRLASNLFGSRLTVSLYDVAVPSRIPFANIIAIARPRCIDLRSLLDLRSHRSLGNRMIDLFSNDANSCCSHYSKYPDCFVDILATGHYPQNGKQLLPCADLPIAVIHYAKHYQVDG